MPHNATPSVNNSSMPSEMSSAFRVRQVLITCGTNDSVVSTPATPPRRFTIEWSAMSDYDAEHCLARYFEVVRGLPERFVNPPGDIYEILLDPARIEHARSQALRDRQRGGLPTSDTRVGVLAEDPYLFVMRDAVRFADGSYGLY